MITKSVFFWRREIQAYWEMQWSSPFQTYSSISCGQCLNSGNHLYNENIDHLHHPPKFSCTLQSQHLSTLSPWQPRICFFFFFLFTYFLSECYTNGIICYVALWVWLLSHTIIRDLSVMLRISLFSFYFVYFSEQPSIKGYVTVYPFISGRNLSCFQFLIVMNKTAIRFMYRF